MKQISSIVLTIIILLMGKGFAQDNPLRLIALGSCYLSFEDESNEISIYDFGDNPAGIVLDQKISWRRVAGWSNYFHGDFRRLLDPASQLQFHLQAEAVKPMSDKKSVSRGYIQYYTEDLIDVYRGLEYEPYHDSFTAIDTTTGTFDYYGPKLGFEYGRRVNSFLSLGARVQYRLHDGLKREPTKTKVDGRMIYGDIGAMIDLPIGITLGLVFRPYTEQYRLNATKSFLLDYPIIYKYFGDSLLVKNDKVSTYNRKIADDGHSSDATLIIPLSSSLTFAVKAGKFLQSRTISENISEGKRNIDDYGAWQKEGNFVDLNAQWRATDLPFHFGFSYSWMDWSSWARTPRYQTLFETMKGANNTLGIGIGFDKIDFPVKIGVDYYLQNYSEEKNNYFQHYHWERDIKIGQLHSGIEYQVGKSVWLRGGFVDGETIPEYHLSLDSASFRQISGGIVLGFGSIVIDIIGYYQKWAPKNNISKREQLSFMFQLTQIL